jgi:putative transposase
VLLTFYDFPAEHWKRLRTTNVESTFATVRLRQRTTMGPGCRDAGPAIAYKLLDAAQARWRRANGHEFGALVRAGATLIDEHVQERNNTPTPTPPDRGTPPHPSTRFDDSSWPACQCCKISTTSIMSNVLLAIR